MERQTPTPDQDRLTCNCTPYAFSKLFQNFHMVVLLGLGCSHNFRGTGYCWSAIFSSIVEAINHKVDAAAALEDILSSYSLSMLRPGKWLGCWK